MLIRGLWFVRKNLALYLWCNCVYYGLIVLFMLLVLLSPEIQEKLIEEIIQQIETEGTLLGFAGEAYFSGSVPRAALVTFVINLFAGTLLFLSLPSVIFPPLAALLGAYRAVLWGIMFSPAMVDMREPMLLHSVTVLLEGQGYILAVFAGLAAFKGFLKPTLYNKTGRLAGYGQGWLEAWPVYIWIIIILAAAAVYEAIIVIGMMH